MAIYRQTSGQCESKDGIYMKKGAAVETVSTIWKKAQNGLVKIYDYINNCIAGGWWQYGHGWQHGTGWREKRK